MSNASLRPSKLANHRDKKHPQMKTEDIETLPVKRARCDREALITHFGILQEEKPALQCSFEVAYRIAKCKKLHAIAENLIKPCSEKMVEILIGLAAKKKIQQASLSNNTIRRRIDSMAVDMC